jgi:hypothetical protein
MTIVRGRGPFIFDCEFEDSRSLLMCSFARVIVLQGMVISGVGACKDKEMSIPWRGWWGESNKRPGNVALVRVGFLKLE